VFALILLIGGIYHAVKQISTYGKEITTGIVVLHSWEHARLPSQPGYTDKAIITYAYSINGKKHTSTKIGYGFNVLSAFRFIEEKKFQKYPIGSNVNVYLNQSSPEHSVVEKGLSVSVILEIFLAVLLFYLGKNIGQSKT